MYSLMESMDWYQLPEVAEAAPLEFLRTHGLGMLRFAKNTILVMRPRY